MTIHQRWSWTAFWPVVGVSVGLWAMAFAFLRNLL
jgi:hypothetical protein